MSIQVGTKPILTFDHKIKCMSVVSIFMAGANDFHCTLDRKC